MENILQKQEAVMSCSWSGTDILEMLDTAETYPRDSKAQFSPVGHTSADASASHSEALHRWRC